MLIVALVLAVIGLAALVTAVVTSNELVAWVCIGSSVLGVILLIIDAIRERTRAEAGYEPAADASAGGTFNAENADEAIPAEAAIAEGATMDDPEVPVETVELADDAEEPVAEESAEPVDESAEEPAEATEEAEEPVESSAEQLADEVPSPQAEALETDEVEAQEAEAAADEASDEAADQVEAQVEADEVEAADEK
ncbi:hypothetical protein [Mycolicibacterium brumae]|uniref:hypothetical protein n=1 Tax=Mycolicibacterium brumae TaxID=85968 RepID=UPI000A9D1EF2|nr:hypothetical protein [Mycolicibacterium brumae]MCV7194661.1 hypothetical protein [Mycolicibacterium brumae]RWA19141.1 hypothetical protein MBRU_17295 [Mycolicibacterium brumae DSM 44177]UWW08409.1 hypothetical protein L2Z93_001463 [Mycolicibacterium brumae]